MAENNNNMKFVIGAIGASALAYYVYCKYGKDDSNSNNKNTKKMVDKSKIIVVSADESHSKDIWTWRNDPITIGMSLNNNYVEKKEHNIWFEKLLSNQNIKIYIAEEDGIPVGIARYEPLDFSNSVYEISINIAPKKRSKGLGKIILRKTIKYLFDEER